MITGLGKNLTLTPPEWFDYPSFGVNTIYRYEGWRPTYFVGVDQRLMREDGDAIKKIYADIPKFIPRPNLNKWNGDNFYRFLHRTGEMLLDGRDPTSPSFFEDGLTYTNVIHVALQIAWHMGFTTMLLIGIQYKPGKYQEHFWGCDHGTTAHPNTEPWFDGYRELVARMKQRGITVLNISEDTYLDADIIPRGDWRDWRKYENKNA